MRRILTACAILCICIAPALAGPKEKGSKGDCTCADIKKTGDGWCGHCKDGMVASIEVKDKKLYEAMKDSSYAKCAEKGELVKASEIKCADCKKNYESHKDGWCKKCNAGLVGHYMYKDKAAYEKADHCMTVLRNAAKAKCDGCAVAMVTDNKCAHCKVSYKDGSKVKS